jgi:peptidoglycan/LPS O-acetylase OafA/YrhL
MMSDQLQSILSAIVVVLACVFTASVMARKSGFYRGILGDTAHRQLPLDGARGLLALAVLAAHSDFAHEWLTTGCWESNSSLIVFFGQGAVLVFFMITGYLFWGKAMQAMGRVSPVTLWMGRLRRLGPLYIFSALLVLFASFPKVLTSSWHDGSQYVIHLSSLGLLKWTNLNELDSTAINGGVQWSLWYEWRFYLALPLLAWFAVERRVFILCGLVIAWVFCTKSAFGTLGAGYWTAFLPGMLAAYLFQKESVRKRFTTHFTAIGALACCIVVLVLTKCGGIRWSLVALVPVFFAVAAGNTFFGILSHPATRLLGTISYSLYLLHCIILMGVLKALKFVVDFNQLPLHYYSIILMGIGALIIVACMVSYRWIEYPALKWRMPIGGRLGSPGSIRSRPVSVPQGQTV